MTIFEKLLSNVKRGKEMVAGRQLHDAEKAIRELVPAEPIRVFIKGLPFT